MVCLGREHRLQSGEDSQSHLKYRSHVPASGLGSVPRFWPFGRVDSIGKTK